MTLLKQNQSTESGLVTFIVLVLVMLLTVLLVADAFVLSHLKAELKQVEARQLKSAALLAAGSISNAPPTVIPATP